MTDLTRLEQTSQEYSFRECKHDIAEVVATQVSSSGELNPVAIRLVGMDVLSECGIDTTDLYLRDPQLLTADAELVLGEPLREIVRRAVDAGLSENEIRTAMLTVLEPTVLHEAITTDQELVVTESGDLVPTYPSA